MNKRENQATNLAKYAWIPDVSVGFQYSRIGAGTTNQIDDGRDAWMIPLKVTIPLWQNRVQSSIQEAKRNLNARQANLTQTENLTEYEIKSTYYRFITTRETVELYRSALIPQAEINFHSAQAGYEAGQMNILTLIDSEKVYLNSKIAYHQELSEHLKSFAALKRAVGTDVY